MGYAGLVLPNTTAVDIITVQSLSKMKR
jgi:hypothetical protein